MDSEKTAPAVFFYACKEQGTAGLQSPDQPGGWLVMTVQRYDFHFIT